MIKLKNYNRFFTLFSFLFLFFLLNSCTTKKYYNYKIEGKQLPVSKESGETEAIESFINPYRNHINKDLDNVLAYCPETMDKSKGEWQTNIGNLMADLTVEMANPVFQSREKKAIDICLLNHGGIRSIIPKGNVTTRTAYEVMPFENSLVVVELKGDQLKEMADYIIKERKPHPLSGLKIVFDKNSKVVKSLTVNGKAIENQNIYYVVTSDYLSNGGDKMDFFKKTDKVHDLHYKLRNVIIDYFKKIDTLPVATDKRIIAE